MYDDLFTSRDRLFGTLIIIKVKNLPTVLSVMSMSHPQATSTTSSGALRVWRTSPPD